MKLDLLRSKVILGLLAASIGLTACESGSLLERDTIDYRSATQRPTLEIPPDLTQLQRSDDFVVPGTVVDFTQYSDRTTGQSSMANASNIIGDVTMRRDGDKRWLVVERTPEQIWSALEGFWQERGFVLVLDDPKLGVMETDWAENRAKIPQDFIRNFLGSVFDSLYSTGERDKFRTRVEVSEHGTEIFITHRGVIEVYTDRDQNSTVWQPRPADVELETEMLRRLMIYLGVSEERANQAIAQNSQEQERATVVQSNGQVALSLSEDFDRSWRAVGVSLDRISFTVVNRDRSQGIYYVRYTDIVEDGRMGGDGGLLSDLLGTGGSQAQGTTADYIVRLVPSSGDGVDQTVIYMTDVNQKPVDTKIAARVMNALADDLN